MEENGNGRPKFDGVEVYMDGKTWIVPPLSVRQFREHIKILLDADVTADNFHEKLDDRLPIVLAAFQRNYPDMTQDKLLDMIDLSTFSTVIQAIARAGGIRPLKPGE